MCAVLQTGMSNGRKEIVLDIFQQLDENGNGLIPANSILSKYDVSTHPSVGNRKFPLGDAERVIHTFFTGCTPQATVSRTDFLDFYMGISLEIGDDESFELSCRNGWRLSPSMSSSSTGTRGVTERRVLVKRGGGVESVVELSDSAFSGTKFDANSVTSRLREMGMRDIQSVRIS